MPSRRGMGQSQWTRRKQEDLEQFLNGLWFTWAGNALRRWPKGTELVYIDANAGSGYNDHPDAQCDGSPVVFLKNCDLPCEVHLIEQQQQYVDELWDRVVPFMDEGMNVSVTQGDNKIAVFDILEEIGRGRLGLIYFDPNGPTDRSECEFDFIADVCRRPEAAKLDVLVRLSGTALTRTRRVYSKYKRLDEYVLAINKKHWIIKEPDPSDNNRWTFLFGCNYLFSGWRRMGWHELNSDRGQGLFDELSLSKQELEEKYNDQPPKKKYHQPHLTGLMTNTYDIRLTGLLERRSLLDQVVSASGAVVERLRKFIT